MSLEYGTANASLLNKGNRKYLGAKKINHHHLFHSKNS